VAAQNGCCVKCDRNDIPDFELRLEAGRGEPAIRMIRNNRHQPIRPAPRKGRAGESSTY
jgi:hypothetical protein